MTWHGAGNDPRLSAAFQLGMADQRALSRPGKSSHANTDSVQ